MVRRTAGLVPTRATSTIAATSSDTSRFYRDSAESGTEDGGDLCGARDKGGIAANLVGRRSRTARKCLRSRRSFLTHSIVTPRDAPSRGIALSPARHVYWRNTVLGRLPC